MALPAEQMASALDPVINLVSSEDEQEDNPAPPPSKKPRYSPEVTKQSSSRSRATSTSSQATIPQPLSPTSLGLQYSLREYSVTEAAPEDDSTIKDAAFQLDPGMFLGMTDDQIRALTAGDHLWWMSDSGELQLACCSHVSSTFSSDDSSSSVFIDIIWDPCGKCDPQRCFQSSQARLQRHFFQGQAVAWQHDGITEQGEVNGHQLSPSGVEFMVDAHSSTDWCPWVPSCELTAICSPGQSSSWSFSSMLDDSTAVSTGVFDPYEYLPLSPVLPSSPVQTVSCSLPNSPRPNSPDSIRAAEADSLASVAARLCSPTPAAASRPSATLRSPTGPRGSQPHSQPTSAAAAAPAADASPTWRPLQGQQSHSTCNLNKFLAATHNPTATSVHDSQQLDVQGQPLHCEAPYPSGLASQPHVHAAADAHAHPDPGQAPDCNLRQLSSNISQVSDADQDGAKKQSSAKPEHNAMKFQLQHLTDERERKGKGPPATAVAPGGFLLEEDSDDADLLMDLSWANVKPRGA